MEHVLVRRADADELETILPHFLEGSLDGELFDRDVLEHASTFVLAAFSRNCLLGFLPVQQPLMCENFIVRPGLSDAEKAQTLTRLVEHAVEETYVRDAGEIYFLSRDPDTLRFAERHLFYSLPNELQVRRLNLRETFGA